MHRGRIRNRRKPVAEMNVVPYIDVMLVLLVIFMVTAPMLNQGVKVDLPQVRALFWRRMRRKVKKYRSMCALIKL